jgi:hypothetical protein
MFWILDCSLHCPYNEEMDRSTRRQAAPARMHMLSWRGPAGEVARTRLRIMQMPERARVRKAPRPRVSSLALLHGPRFVRSMDFNRVQSRYIRAACAF